MMTLLPFSGTWLGNQLVASFQSPPAMFVHVSVADLAMSPPMMRQNNKVKNLRADTFMVFLLIFDKRKKSIKMCPSFS